MRESRGARFHSVGGVSTRNERRARTAHRSEIRRRRLPTPKRFCAAAAHWRPRQHHFGSDAALAETAAGGVLLSAAKLPPSVPKTASNRVVLKKPLQTPPPPCATAFSAESQSTTVSLRPREAALLGEASSRSPSPLSAARSWASLHAETSARASASEPRAEEADTRGARRIAPPASTPKGSAIAGRPARLAGMVITSAAYAAAGQALAAPESSGAVVGAAETGREQARSVQRRARLFACLHWNPSAATATDTLGRESAPEGVRSTSTLPKALENSEATTLRTRCARS